MNLPEPTPDLPPLLAELRARTPARVLALAGRMMQARAGGVALKEDVSAPAISGRVQ